MRSMDRIASENGCAGLVREHDSGAVNLHGASHLIARLAFETRYSGARQYIFRIEITVMGSGIWGSNLVRIAGNDLEFPRR
jgi:hypothetical protein